MLKKVIWIDSQDLNRMCDPVREITHFCPYCVREMTYPLTNGEVADIVFNALDLECIECHKPYKIAWEGDSNFMRYEDDYLDF